MEKNAEGRWSSYRGFLYALGGAALGATNFVTGKYGLRGFNTETFSLIWAAASALYALASILLTRGGEELMVRPGARPKILFMGASTGLSMIAGWAGVARLNPAFASFLWRLTPVLTIIGSVTLLHEKLRPIEFFPFLLIIAGGLISTIGRWSLVGSGVILAVVSCSASALQMLIAKSEIASLSPRALVFYRGSLGAATVAIWALARGNLDFQASASYWIVTLFGSLLAPWASFLLVFRSYRHWNLSRSTIIQAMQPLFVLPLALIFLHSLPTAVEAVGGGAIMVGAMWMGRIHAARQDASAASE